MHTTDLEPIQHLITSILTRALEHDPNARRTLDTDVLEEQLGAHGGLTKRLVTMLADAGYLTTNPITDWEARDDHVDIQLTLAGLRALEGAPAPPKGWRARDVLHDSAAYATLAQAAWQAWVLLVR